MSITPTQRQADEAAIDTSDVVGKAAGPVSGDRPSTPAKSKTPARWLRLTGKEERAKTNLPDDLGARRKAHLWVDNITVSFDGFRALNQLTLILDEGELRCIIGPNGAGKTTLMDCITGKTRPDTGNVYLIGKDRERISLIEKVEHEVAQLGIGRKFQRPTVFHDHSVFENLELALGDRSVFRSLWGRTKPSQLEKIDEILTSIGLSERR